MPMMADVVGAVRDDHLLYPQRVVVERWPVVFETSDHFTFCRWFARLSNQSVYKNESGFQLRLAGAPKAKVFKRKRSNGKLCSETAI
jgi:hypothetical protein